MIYDADGIHDSIRNQGHWSESTETPTLTLFLENLENRSLRLLINFFLILIII